MPILSGNVHPAKEWQHRLSSALTAGKESNGRSKTVDSNWAVRIQQRRESEDGENDEDKEIKRGDVFWVDVPAFTRHVAQKIRPCVVISNDRANKTDNNIMVVPLTHSIKRLDLACNVMVDSLHSVAKCNTVMTVGRELILSKYSEVTQWELQHISAAVATHICG